MIALLFIIGSFLMGTGLVKKIFPFATVEEKLLWGLVTGLMLSTWAGYLVSRIAGNLYFGLMLFLTIITWITGIGLLFRDFKRIKEFDYKAFFKENIPLICLLIAFLPVYLYFFLVGMFHSINGSYYLTATSWYDLCLHLAIATGFLYGQNFPPVYNVLPPEPLRYPFLPDFQASILMNLGFDIWTTFALTSIIMATALTGIYYCFARRLTDSKIVSLIATFLFLLNGGFGFLYFFEDWRKSKFSFLEALLNIKQNYTDWWDMGIKWTNLITSGIIPQRAMLYGMPIAFIILSLLAITWRRWSETENEKRWDGSELLIKAGILTGLLPLFHTHSYMMVGMVSIFLFLIKPRYAWISFWVPAVLLAVPQLADLESHVASGAFLHFQPGWMGYLDKEMTFFMVKNFGLPVLLIFPAFWQAPRYLKTFYLPFAALMGFCFLFIISPNDYDNLKLMYYWYAVTTPVIAIWLYKLATVYRQRSLTVLLVICSVLSAVLSLYRESTMVSRVFTNTEIEAANFARENLPPKAMILTGQNNNQPLLCLAGKPIVLGFDFWIKSHGYSEGYYNAILNDVKTMYAAKPVMTELLAKYKVDYIYMGYQEKDEFKPDLDYFNKHYGIVFKNKDVTIYDVHKILFPGKFHL